MDSLEALDVGEGVLAAPKLGVFTLRVSEGDIVRAGALVGTLRVLERRYRVLVPRGAGGVVEGAPPQRETAVGYGERLLRLVPAEGVTLAGATRAADAAAEAVDGVAVVAPIAGIFYRRASPAVPPYVEVGQSIATGQTVGLIEVMKTFNPVVHTGAPGTVAATPVEDRQEVTSGQVLVVVR